MALLSSFRSVPALVLAAFACLAPAGSITPAMAQPAPAAAPEAPKTAPDVPQIAPGHLAIAEEVLKASGLMVMIENATPNVIDGLRANISRQRPELVKEIEESLAAVQATIPGLRADGLKNAAALLAERLTEGELKEINTFLTSAAGRKYVTLLPQYVEDIVPLLEGWGMAASERMTRLFQEEMAKRGHRI